MRRHLPRAGPRPRGQNCVTKMSVAAVLPVSRSSSVVLNLGDAPAVISLASLIGDAALSAKVNSLVERGDAPGCIHALLPAASTLLASSQYSNGQVSSAFAILASTAEESGVEGSALHDLLLEIANTAKSAGSASEKPEEKAQRSAARVKALAAVYHVAAAPVTRANILQILLETAHERNVDALVAPVLARVDSWVEAWALPTAEAQKLHRACVDVAEALYAGETGGPAAERAACTAVLERMEAYLKTFEAPGSNAAAGVEVARRACALFLAAPHTFASDMLNLSAVKALASAPDAASKAAGSLLTAFLTGTNDAVASALSAHKAALPALGLDEGKLRSKARLCMLAAAASASRANGGNGVVSYADLRATLGTSDDMVLEATVLEAVHHGVVVAKMDQIESTVTFEDVTPRVFGDEEWKTLLHDLKRWEVGLQRLMHVTL